MVNIDKESLEKALSSNNSLGQTESDEQPVEQPSSQAPEMSKEEEIGFHKGSLNTLAAERNELVKMIGNIEAIMQAHLKRLEELGVKIQTEGKK